MNNNETIINENKFTLTPEEMEFASAYGMNGYFYRIQVSPEDCTGCGACANACIAREKAVEKTPAQKAVDTRRKNIIAEQKEMLDKSTSSAAHKQWITKKNNEISAKDEKIAKLTSEKKDLKAELKKLQVENKALAKEVARLEKKLAAKPAVKTESKAPAKTNTKAAPAKASKTAKASKK